MRAKAMTAMAAFLALGAGVAFAALPALGSGGRGPAAGGPVGGAESLPCCAGPSPSPTAAPSNAALPAPAGVPPETPAREAIEQAIRDEAAATVERAFAATPAPQLPAPVPWVPPPATQPGPASPGCTTETSEAGGSISVTTRCFQHAQSGGGSGSTSVSVSSSTTVSSSTHAR